MKHLESLLGLTAADIRRILDLSLDLKGRWRRGERPAWLAGRVLGLLFEKPSLRTRISFEAAMAHLGGTSIFLSAADAGLNGREKLSDVARVLGSYCDALVIRTFSHSIIKEAVQVSACPVINGLTDSSHPCQALADLLTIEETFGTLAGKTIAFVGDGNNVARSLAAAAAYLDMRFILSAPPGYEFQPDFYPRVRARIPKPRIESCPDPVQAVRQADVIYTDVWTSMGQEAENAHRQAVFAPYQVNAALMKAAPAGARFMHCLPAKRGQEVTDDVLDGAQSIAFLQAENRMHLAKGALAWLLDAQGS